MSFYPDGTTRNRFQAIVNIPAVPQQPRSDKVPKSDVKKIICHRKISNREEYLVKWKHIQKRSSLPRVYSWHTVEELSKCLKKLQSYVDSLSEDPAENQHGDEQSPDSDDHTSQIVGARSNQPDPNAKCYNGELIRSDGVIRIKEMILPSIEYFNSTSFPTAEMRTHARDVRRDTAQAAHAIRDAFSDLISNIPTHITLSNNIDNSSPPLDFRFIDKCEAHPDVQVFEDEFVAGCGAASTNKGQRCRPDMGQNIGCEYARCCECLEYAAIDQPRLTAEEKEELENNPDVDLVSLPKRYPYFSGSKWAKSNCLVPFYLENRAPIYECNHKCACGPNCKTRVVQKGRQVPIEIFKTANRGWGLRCLRDLPEGAFIDTYRGEIITNEVADQREAKAAKRQAKQTKTKGIYLYSLDKFVGFDGIKPEDCYVIDGEHIGGPSRFINHSCDPNCRQYTVSYNKYDRKIYELAFFTIKSIKKGTELTFDYLDKDNIDEDSDVEMTDIRDESDAMICKCGAAKCRKRLFM